jgi:hypothetical protein
VSLEALVGEWEVRTSYTEVPPGRLTMEWTLGGAFLLGRSTNEKPFPSGITLMTPERQYYFDDRGVVREYEMSFDGTTWTLFRDDPDPFPQRFVGTLSDDGNTIECVWEKQDPDWQTDFTGTYTRIP